jgi:hypothetical protein
MHVYNMDDFARDNFFVFVEKGNPLFCDVTVSESTVM